MFWGQYLGPFSIKCTVVPSLALAPCALAGPFYPWPLAPDPGPGRGRGRSRLQSTLQVASLSQALHTHNTPSGHPSPTFVVLASHPSPSHRFTSARYKSLPHSRLGSPAHPVWFSVHPAQPQLKILLHFLSPSHPPTTHHLPHQSGHISSRPSRLVPFSCTSLPARAITAKFVSSKFSFVLLRLRVVFGIRLETEFFTHSHSLPPSSPHQNSVTHYDAHILLSSSCFSPFSLHLLDGTHGRSLTVSETRGTDYSPFLQRLVLTLENTTVVHRLSRS